MTTDPDGWERVGPWLQNELDSQGLTLGRLERDAGVSYQTLRKLLDGEPITRRDRLIALARALGYRHDAFEAVRAGDPPVRLADELPEANGVGDRLTAVEAGLAQVREGLAAVVRRLDEGAGSP